MQSSKKGFRLVVFFLLFSLTIIFPEAVLARGFRGGGFGSRRGSWGGSRHSSRTRSSSSRASGWGSKKSASKKAFSGSRSAARKPLSKADRALMTKAKASGTHFNNRKDAVKHFRSTQANKYTSSYATKPATRPKHIPQNTQVNGKPVNIRYNSSYGGYGYMNNGRWVVYNVMTDMVMLNMLMREGGYYYGQPMYGGSGYGRVGRSMWPGIMVVLFLIVVAAFLYRMP